MFLCLVYGMKFDVAAPSTASPTPTPAPADAGLSVSGRWLKSVFMGVIIDAGATSWVVISIKIVLAAYRGLFAMEDELARQAELKYMGLVRHGEIEFSKSRSDEFVAFVLGALKWFPDAGENVLFEGAPPPPDD